MPVEEILAGAGAPADELARFKVLILGGCPADEPCADPQHAQLKQVGQTIGRKLAHSVQSVIVCSCHPTSLDRYVVQGLSEAKSTARLLIFEPDDARPDLKPGESVQDQWSAYLRENPGLRKSRFQVEGVSLSGSQGFASAFLLCQLQAQRECDAVLTVGGKPSASTEALLGFIGDAKAVLPYPVLHGAAEAFLERRENSLRTILGEEGLSALRADAAPADCVEHLSWLIGPRSGQEPHRVFLSYSWARKAEADRVEAVLARIPGVDLFRDEHQIMRGDSISEGIHRAIDDCSVFLALWSQEYAVSPHCHDEFAYAQSQQPAPRIVLLRLDETRPVWPTLRGDSPEEWARNWPRVDYKDIRDELLKLFSPSAVLASRAGPGAPEAAAR